MRVCGSLLLTLCALLFQCGSVNGAQLVPFSLDAVRPFAEKGAALAELLAASSDAIQELPPCHRATLAALVASSACLLKAEPGNDCCTELSRLMSSCSYRTSFDAVLGLLGEPTPHVEVLLFLASRCPGKASSPAACQRLGDDVAATCSNAVRSASCCGTVASYVPTCFGMTEGSAVDELAMNSGCPVFGPRACASAASWELVSISVRAQDGPSVTFEDPCLPSALTAHLCTGYTLGHDELGVSAEEFDIIKSTHSDCDNRSVQPLSAASPDGLEL